MSEQEPVVIRDNRKFDPVTGEARKVTAEGNPAAAAGSERPAASPAAAGDASASDAGASEAAVLLAERTADVQRIQAEYANYRKRADRERAEAEHLGVARALAALLPILDDFERAIAHADVPEQVQQILDKQQRALEALGLEKFGAEGDPFDPAIHEAVLHDVSDEVGVPTVTKAMRAGYKHRDRLLRPAMVGVTDPVLPSDPASASSGDTEPAAGSQDQADDAHVNGEK